MAIPTRLIKTGSTVTGLAEFQTGETIDSIWLPPVFPTYISGLQLVWNSNTSISVSSGSAYIPSLSQVTVSNSLITKAGLSLAANTWYHVYLFMSGGTADVEIVTTAPSAPYAGKARTKTGDTSRRYIGSVRTDASAAIRNFLHATGDKVYWRVNASTMSRVLTNGNASVATDIALISVAPITTVAVTARFINNDNTYAYVVGNADFTAGGSAFQVNPVSAISVEMVTTSVPSINYWFLSTVTGGAFVDVISYSFER